MPNTPPPPPTLQNSPPVKPVVRMEHGLLTIDAPNSTLSDILSGIAAATGATVEGVSPTDRVAVLLGPGDARAVIAALLRGTPYNYILLGSQSDPHAVTRILLSRAGPASTTASRPMPAPPPRPQPAPPPFTPPPVPPVHRASPLLQPGQLRQPPPQTASPAGEQPGTHPAQKAAPTTPEELFRQLLHPPQQQK